MTTLAGWAMGLCAAGVACAVLDMLLPSGGMKRVTGLLTAVFFFCCLIGPLGEAVGEWRTWFSSETVADAQVDATLDETAIQQVLAMLSTTLEADAAARVEPYGLTVKKVTVERDISRPDGIYIQRVRLVLDKDDHPVSDTAVKELERAWGTSVEVYYTDGQ